MNSAVKHFLTSISESPKELRPANVALSSDAIRNLVCSLEVHELFSEQWFKTSNVISILAYAAAAQQSNIDLTLGDDLCLFEGSFVVIQEFGHHPDKVSVIINILKAYKECMLHPDNQLSGYKNMVRELSTRLSIRPRVLSERMIELEEMAGLLLGCCLEFKEILSNIPMDLFFSYINSVFGKDHIYIVGDQDVNKTQEALILLYFHQIAQRLSDMESQTIVEAFISHRVIENLVKHLHTHYKRVSLKLTFRALHGLALILETEDGIVFQDVLFPPACYQYLFLFQDVLVTKAAEKSYENRVKLAPLSRFIHSARNK
ncbi:hypothetical protein PCE1_001681 [Barthelona sp. PCE]